MTTCARCGCPNDDTCKCSGPTPSLRDSLTLSRATIEELQVEIARRQKAAEKPKPLDKPDFSALVGWCEEYVKGLDGESGNDIDEQEHFIFEAAMVAVYGSDVWKWINARLK